MGGGGGPRGWNTRLGGQGGSGAQGQGLWARVSSLGLIPQARGVQARGLRMEGCHVLVTLHIPGPGAMV